MTDALVGQSAATADVLAMSEDKQKPGKEQSSA